MIENSTEFSEPISFTGESSTEPFDPSLMRTGQTGDLRSWYKWILLNIFSVMTVGFTLNVIVATAYIRSSLLTQGKPVHQLIFNMTISDIVSGLTSLPFNTFLFSDVGQRHITTRKYPCILSVAGVHIAFDSTMTSLILISCERLFAIPYPLQHMHRVTRKTCRLAILTMWTYLIIKHGLMFFWNRWQPGGSCYGLSVMTFDFLHYVYDFNLYGCIVTIVLLNISLGIMVFVVQSNAANIKASVQKSDQQKLSSLRSELKVVKVVVLAVIVLFVTWIPNNTLGKVVLYYIENARPIPFKMAVTFNMSRVLNVVSIVTDPIIFLWLNSQCRAAVLGLFGRQSKEISKQLARSGRSLPSTQSSAQKSTIGTESEASN